MEADKSQDLQSASQTQKKATGREEDGERSSSSNQRREAGCPPGPDSYPDPKRPPGSRAALALGAAGASRAAADPALRRERLRPSGAALLTPRASCGSQAGAAASPASLPLARLPGSIRITSWSKYAGQPENQSRHNQRLVNCHTGLPNLKSEEAHCARSSKLTFSAGWGSGPSQWGAPQRGLSGASANRSAAAPINPPFVRPARPPPPPQHQRPIVRLAGPRDLPFSNSRFCPGQFERKFLTDNLPQIDRFVRNDLREGSKKPPARRLGRRRGLDVPSAAALPSAPRAGPPQTPAGVPSAPPPRTC
ncbi:PREDICTED: uncharacterized protein LOC101374092 [Odobenus rosmarus divergens]|uniref:Uncharacterized protein LOC101374092 n=1 Tax=Odobenus rosmarus divergens TaxID=9708 RepID=A0A9B0GES7_ODORO